MKPESPAPAAVVARMPAFELWIAFVFSLVPHVAGLVVGGAVIVTIIDGVALVIAYLQFREDSHARRASHWLVWVTIGVGAIWMVYAVFVGTLLLLGQLFCINQDCRGPIR